MYVRMFLLFKQKYRRPEIKFPVNNILLDNNLYEKTLLCRDFILGLEMKCVKTF